MILSRHFFTPGHHLPSYAHYPTLHYYMDESPISLPSTEKPTVSFIFIHSLFSIYAHECALIHVTLRNLHTRQEKKTNLTNLIHFSTYFWAFPGFRFYAQIKLVNHMSQPKRRVVTVPARALQSANHAQSNRNSRVRAAQAGKSRVQALLQNLGKFHKMTIKNPILTKFWHFFIFQQIPR